jgi:hypothetical protein
MERSEPEDFQYAEGISVRLRWLDESSAYEGVLDGGPTYEMNEIVLDRFVNVEGTVDVVATLVGEVELAPEPSAV